MKTTTTFFVALVALLLLQSCSPEEMETAQSRPVIVKNESNDAMMQRDSISRDVIIDPPVRPKP